MRLAQVEGLHVVARSPVGQWRPYVVVDAETRVWFAKAMRGNAILAEAVWHGLASKVGSAQPQCALGRLGGERVWLSRAVADAVHWQPTNVDGIANAPALAAGLTVDGLLGNEDRHEENVLLAPGPAAQFVAYLIDAEGCAATHPPKFAQWQADRVTDPSQLPHFRGIDFEALRPHADATAMRLASLPASELDMLAREAVAASDVAEAWLPGLQSVLKARCGNAARLTSAYFDRLARL